MNNYSVMHHYADHRVFNAIQTAKLNDNSFKEKENFLTLLTGGIKYTQPQVREIWFNAMAIGIQEGLRIGSIEGQRIDIYNSCREKRQKDFLDKFYKLCDEYNCAVVYHPNEGMVIKDLKNK